MSDPDPVRCWRIDKDIFISCLDELKNHGLPCHALGKDRIGSSKLEAMRDPRVNFLADEDGGSKPLVHTFDARGQIHRVAKSRVVHAFHRTKVADDGLADVYAKPREEWLQALGFKLRVELFARRLARKCCADRGVLLEGRQHHAAPAGARMDSRPL